VFYIAAGVYLVGVIVLLFFPSSDIEPWAAQKKETKETKILLQEESIQL
jgi:hypothetical protein